jgi:hypothetical protein
VVDNHTPLKRAIVQKAGKYGQLTAPYIVAVNAPELDDREDEMQALFGAGRYSIDLADIDSETKFSREPDGVWIGPGHRPRYRRLDGVLIFRGVSPWSLDRPTCLYLNPYVSARLPSALLQLPYAAAEHGQMAFHSGLTAGTIISLGT